MAGWICKGCGRRFGRVNQSHTCAPARTVDDFFAGRPPVQRRAFDAIAAHLGKLRPIHVEAVIACVMFKRTRSFAEVRAKRDGLDLIFLLSRTVEHPRIARTFRLSANRVVHYVLVRTKADVDSQVRAWLTEAYASSPV